jgi:hypothetical protein
MVSPDKLNMLKWISQTSMWPCVHHSWNGDIPARISRDAMLKQNSLKVQTITPSPFPTPSGDPQIVHPLHTGVYAMSPPPLRHDIDGFLAATKQGPARPQMSTEGAKM